MPKHSAPAPQPTMRPSEINITVPECVIDVRIKPPAMTGNPHSNTCVFDLLRASMPQSGCVTPYISCAIPRMKLIEA